MVITKLPSSTNARSLALVLRECLDHLGFKYDYSLSRRHFSRFTFVITLDRFTHTFRFQVTSPAEFELDCWDESPSHGGKLHFIEIKGLDEQAPGHIKRLLRILAVSLPLRPWKFKLSHRLGVGLLLPEFLYARKDWTRAGVTEADLKDLEPVILTRERVEVTGRELDELRLVELEEDEDDDDDEGNDEDLEGDELDGEYLDELDREYLDEEEDDEDEDDDVEG